MIYRTYLALLFCCSCFSLTAQREITTIKVVPYSAETENRMLSRTPVDPSDRRAVQDTSSAALAYIGLFQDGYKAWRKDGRMGLLDADLRIRVPFLYADIQEVVTGVNRGDVTLIAKRSNRGRYATIEENSDEPTSEFVLSYNPRLRIFNDLIIDAPQPRSYWIRDRDGSALSEVPYEAVWTHPVLMTNGHRVLTVRPIGSDDVALFNADSARQVTPAIYQSIHRVDPIMEPRTYIPLLEATYFDRTITLLRPSGKVLSPVEFIGVEDYNNWKELRTFFGLPDDPAAEAIAWTKDMMIYVVYQDDTVRKLGQYTLKE